MAFKNIKIVGDGLAQTVLTNSATLEGVVTNLVAYNGTAGALSFSLLIGGVSVITESVPANDSYRLPDKINVPVSGVLTINAATGVDVTISSYQAAIDPAAALTAAQTTATTTAGYLADFQADYIGKYADDAAADASGFTISAGVFYFKDTGTPATSGLRVYNGGWDAAALDASGALLASNDLSDVASAPTAISNLGITATAAELNYNDITTPGTSEASKTVTADANGDVILLQELKATSYNESYVAVTSTTNATAVNCETGNTFSHTLTETTTFTFSNPPASGTAFTMSIEIIQDASASGFVLTWPTITWPTATPPTLTATANAVDVFVFTTRDGGTTWRGFIAGQALA
jgi:hypothetical protein